VSCFCAPGSAVATSWYRPILGSCSGRAATPASFLVWLAALRQFEITRAFPIFFGLACVAIATGMVAILGEQVTVPRVAGIVLVGFAILLIGR